MWNDLSLLIMAFTAFLYILQAFAAQRVPFLTNKLNYLVCYSFGSEKGIAFYHLGLE